MRFLGRYKDMLKVGGENVDPVEVEAHLLRQPGVHQVAVVGDPDARLAEVAGGVRHPAPGGRRDVTAEDAHRGLPRPRRQLQDPARGLLRGGAADDVVGQGPEGSAPRRGPAPTRRRLIRRPADGMPRPGPRAAFVSFPRAALARSIPDRFEAQVDADPARTAVVAGTAAWSYGALDAAANAVAHALVARGPVGGRPVMLLIEQGPPLVAAILGVLKAGAVYVPLETAQGGAHVAAVWTEAEPALILADAAGVALAAAAVPGAPVLHLNAILACGAREDAGRPLARPVTRIDPGAPACIYYTSGSTGRRKGVVNSHANVLHNVARYTNTLGIDRDDRLTLLQSPSFSGAVSSLFGALLNGAAGVLIDVHREGTAGLGAWLVRERVTIHHSVPALFRRAIVGAPAFPDLRHVRLEGDAMSRADCLAQYLHE